MEDYICRIIQADLAAQEKKNQCEALERTIRKQVEEEKKLVSHTSWENAKAHVASVRVELDQQVLHENDLNAIEYEEKVKALNQAFCLHKEEWCQEIMNRCLK